MCDPPRIYPSLPEYTPYSTAICDRPRIYPSLPEYTPLLTNICDPPIIKPPSQFRPTFFDKFIRATLSESTLPSQNIPPFLTTVCDPSRIYPSLPEHTPIFNNYIIMRCSQNISLPPSQNIAIFQQLYATLPDTTLPSENRPLFLTTIYPPPSQNISLVPFLQLYVGGGGIFWEAGVDSGRVAHINWLKREYILGERSIFWEGWIIL